MKYRAPPKTQRGVALWMLMILVAMAGGYAFYRSANSQFNKTGQEVKIAAALVRAKEALIARAVTDDNRPGSLPCPDIGDIGINVPYDGTADKFIGAGATQCPSYVGWLPWATLDLPELTDDTGSRLWYVLSSALRDDDSAHPINSDTNPGLTVDGNTNNDIVALIIAPRGALAGQDRSPPAGKTYPSLTPAAYLDGENSNGDNIYVTGPQSDNFNDIVLVITRQELMAAVEKRVANEVRSCLAQHAASTANTDHRYPWPAPLSASGFQGKANSLFGRVPSTQPDAGPEAALKASIIQLSQTLTQLSSAPDASQQLTALNGLGDAILQARNLFDAIFSVSNKLKQVADDAVDQLAGLKKDVGNATSAGGITIIEGIAIEKALVKTSNSNLDELTDQIAQLGIDAFPWQIGQLTTALGRAATSTEYAAITQSIRDLLWTATTARPDISPSLNAAQQAARAACNATANLSLSCEGSTSQTAAASLIGILGTLQNSVEASRVNLRASVISTYASPLASLSAKLRDAPTAENTSVLLTTLTATKASIDGITTGVSDIVTKRVEASAALSDAINSIQFSRPDYSLVDTSTAIAIGKISALAVTINNNELIDNNVSHTSLIAAVAAFKAARTDFVQIDTAIPRPLPIDIKPSANTLGDATVDLEIWAKIVATNAALIAPLAKANPLTADKDPSKAVALNSSAYKLASDALASITGKNESAALLQDYISSPSAKNQANAITALAETNGLVSSLLTAANALGTQLSGTTASAFPITWLSSRCDFLLPKATWWSNNQWANTIFYQISGATMNEPGKLTVNGTGTYRVVALAAGRAFATQNRGTLATANFLENINAHFSRNGDAAAPSGAFATAAPPPPPMIDFNDRLSY